MGDEGSRSRMCASDWECPGQQLCYGATGWAADLDGVEADGGNGTVQGCFCNTFYGWRAGGKEHECAGGMGATGVLALLASLGMLVVCLSVLSRTCVNVMLIRRFQLYRHGSAFSLSLQLLLTTLAILACLASFLLELTQPGAAPAGRPGPKQSPHARVTVSAMLIVQLFSLATIMSVTVHWLEMAATAQLLSQASLRRAVIARRVLVAVLALYALVVALTGGDGGVEWGALFMMVVMYGLMLVVLLARWKLVQLMEAGLRLHRVGGVLHFGGGGDGGGGNGGSGTAGIGTGGTGGTRGTGTGTGGADEQRIKHAIHNVEQCSRRLSGALIAAEVNALAFLLVNKVPRGGWRAVASAGSLSLPTFLTLNFAAVALYSAWAVLGYSRVNVLNLVRQVEMRREAIRSASLVPASPLIDADTKWRPRASSRTAASQQQQQQQQRQYRNKTLPMPMPPMSPAAKPSSPELSTSSPHLAAPHKTSPMVRLQHGARASAGRLRQLGRGLSGATDVAEAEAAAASPPFSLAPSSGDAVIGDAV